MSNDPEITEVRGFLGRIKWLQYMLENAQYIIPTGSYRVGNTCDAYPDQGVWETQPFGARESMWKGIASCTDVAAGIQAAIDATRDELGEAVKKMQKEHDDVCAEVETVLGLGEVQP